MSEPFDINIGSVVGPPGESGQDGYSPVANVSKIGSTTTITITDKTGTTTATVSDGQDGQDGQNGQDGYSPTASVSKSGSTATITVTDKNGTTTATVSDGEDGQDGQDGSDGADGVSPEVTITTITGGHTVTITDADHPQGQTFDVMDGTSGTPYSSNPEMDGTASPGSSSDYARGNHVHPTDTSREPATTYTTLSGTAITQTGADHTMYLCGELASLTFTAPQTGICAVRFTSGSTATVVTLTGVTMPDSWEGAEANTVYEINILNGYGLVAKWAVSA